MYIKDARGGVYVDPTQPNENKKCINYVILKTKILSLKNIYISKKESIFKKNKII